ncbi:hypothetical protein Enr13x_47330 [Stieleria neptunia]|uniref:Uncharacterized protein n=1 Tax=Stieleria neptunia TaxID=2527979 RepID=A0A518HVH6_9BACT|nr:hypothetical protein Enr13x_47330 [Stieleria neptunia]
MTTPADRGCANRHTPIEKCSTPHAPHLPGTDPDGSGTDPDGSGTDPDGSIENSAKWDQWDREDA